MAFELLEALVRVRVPQSDLARVRRDLNSIRTATAAATRGIRAATASISNAGGLFPGGRPDTASIDLITGKLRGLGDAARRVGIETAEAATRAAGLLPGVRPNLTGYEAITGGLRQVESGLRAVGSAANQASLRGAGLLPGAGRVTTGAQQDAQVRARRQLQQDALQRLSTTNIFTGQLAEAQRRLTGFRAALAAANRVGVSSNQVFRALGANIASGAFAAGLLGVARAALSVARSFTRIIRASIAASFRAAIGPARLLATSLRLIVQNLPEVAVAIGAISFRSLVDAQREIQRIRVLLSLAFGREAPEQLALAANTAREFGQTLFDSANLLARLGLTLRGIGASSADVGLIFRGILASTSTQGRTSRELRLIINALEDIGGRGRASLEDLRRQLVQSLPTAIQTARRAFPDLDLEEITNVPALEFFREFGRQSLRDFAQAARTAAQQVQGNINIIRNEFDLLKIALGEVSVPQVLRGFRELLDTLRDSGAIRVLVNGFRNLADSVTLVFALLRQQGAIRFFTDLREELSRLLRSLAVLRGFSFGAIFGGFRAAVSVLTTAFENLSNAIERLFGLQPSANFEDALINSIVIFDNVTTQIRILGAQIQLTFEQLRALSELLSSRGLAGDARRIGEALLGDFGKIFTGPESSILGSLINTDEAQRLEDTIALLRNSLDNPAARAKEIRATFDGVRRKNREAEESARRSGFGLNEITGAANALQSAVDNEVRILGLEAFFAQLQAGDRNPTVTAVEQQGEKVARAVNNVSDTINGFGNQLLAALQDAPTPDGVGRFGLNG